MTGSVGVGCTGSQGPLLGGWPGLPLSCHGRPAGPPPVASLEVVVALLAARVRAGRLARAAGAPLVLRRAVGMLPGVAGA